MIRITRLAEPPHLEEKRTAWLSKFLEKRKDDDKHRPSSSQYAHRKILDVLWAMSCGKCFYCEGKLSGARREVDHHVAVVDVPEKAFDWDNLYLACDNCNGKLRSIPNDQCIDPCDPNVNPEDHLTFDDEVIRPKNDSDLGLQTIKKYKLDSERLDLLRSRTLRQLEKLVTRMLDECRKSGRKKLNSAEMEKLTAFSQPTQAYSLMCSVHLDNAPVP